MGTLHNLVIQAAEESPMIIPTAIATGVIGLVTLVVKYLFKNADLSRKTTNDMIKDLALAESKLTAAWVQIDDLKRAKEINETRFEAMRDRLTRLEAKLDD